MTSPTHKRIRVVAAVIEKDSRYLITQRRPTAVLPLLWEFPGGRVENQETDDVALSREVSHRIGVQIKVGKLISYVKHPYEHYSIDLFLYDCSIVQGEPTAKNVHEFSWVLSSDFDNYSFTPADELSMSRLLGIE